MKEFTVSLREMCESIWRNRGIIFASTKREILGRYRGSFLGLMWSFFNPIFMLAVYTFVFSEVFKSRWSGGGGSKAEFALILFSGLIIFNLFAECINRAPGLVLNNPNYVKKIVYPLEVLPFISLLSALYHALISIGVWLLGYMIVFGVPGLSIVYLPLVIVPFSIFIVGMSWILASLGVYLRDVSQLVGILTTVLMFLSPIFYPASAFPTAYRDLFYMNPITPAVEYTRDLLFWGRIPSGLEIIVCWFVSIVVAWLGFVFFQKTRRGFADVL